LAKQKDERSILGVRGDYPDLKGELPMAMEERVETLRARHARLEHEIDEETHRPLPDQVHVTELKRQKLRIKEEISRLSL
jgi:hypothetical protein